MKILDQFKNDIRSVDYDKLIEKEKVVEIKQWKIILLQKDIKRKNSKWRLCAGRRARRCKPEGRYRYDSFCNVQGLSSERKRI